MEKDSENRRKRHTYRGGIERQIESAEMTKKESNNIFIIFLISKISSEGRGPR